MTTPAPTAIRMSTEDAGIGSQIENIGRRLRKRTTEDFLRTVESIRDGNGSGESTPAKRRERLREASEKLEGVVLNLLIKQMRKTVHHSKLFKGGRAGEIFRARLDQTYARQLAKQHDFGIAESVFQQLSRNL